MPRVAECAGTGWLSADVRSRFKDDWPKNKRGCPMCLPWHCRGLCYDNCGHKGDHVIHSKEEEDTLCTFLTEKFGEYQKNE